MLALLVYCYANGIFSSRRIERATYRDIGVRFVAAKGGRFFGCGCIRSSANWAACCAESLTNFITGNGSLLAGLVLGASMVWGRFQPCPAKANRTAASMLRPMLGEPAAATSTIRRQLFLFGHAPNGFVDNIGL